MEEQTYINPFVASKRNKLRVIKGVILICLALIPASAAWIYAINLPLSQELHGLYVISAGAILTILLGGAGAIYIIRAELSNWWERGNI